VEIFGREGRQGEVLWGLFVGQMIAVVGLQVTLRLVPYHFARQEKRCDGSVAFTRSATGVTGRERLELF
jgi:hypothetical protein